MPRTPKPEPAAKLVEAIAAPAARGRYRVRSFEGGGWHLVERRAFCEVEGARVTAMDLVCSGFRPVE